MKAENSVEFIVAIVDEMSAGGYIRGPDFAEDMAQVIRHAATLERLNVHECNYGLNPNQEKQYEKAREVIGGLLGKYGMTPVFNGDPRGPALGVRCFNTKRYNSWGGEESGFRLIFSGK